MYVSFYLNKLSHMHDVLHSFSIHTYNNVILICIYMCINVRMYECDDLELLIQFTIDTVHCMHAFAFAFNLLIYLLCIQMHIHTCIHICTCVYTMYMHIYVRTCICAYVYVYA